jgi:hypothetical protein
MSAPTLAVPTTPEGLEEWIGDSARMQTVLGDKAQFQELIANYAKNVIAADPGMTAQLEKQKTDLINAQVSTEVQLQLANALKDDAKLNRPNLAPATAPRKGEYPNALGASVNGVYDTANDLFSAVAREGKSPGGNEKLM